MHPGRCYRSGISYDAGLKRYLWCQILPESTDSRGPRYQGGFGIYEATEPWGPWRTVFHAETWAMGPGESGSLPPKWMSEDGRTCHLLFSGESPASDGILASDGKPSLRGNPRVRWDPVSERAAASRAQRSVYSRTKRTRLPTPRCGIGGLASTRSLRSVWRVIPR